MSENTPKKTVLDPNYTFSSPSKSNTTPIEEYDESVLDKTGQDRLAKLKEYREKGILTRKDFEKRVKELFDKYQSSTAATAASTSSATATTANTPTKPATATPAQTTATATATTPGYTITKRAPAATTTTTTPQKATTTSTAPTATTTPVKAPTATAPSTAQAEEDLSHLEQKDRDDLAKLQRLVQSGILTQDEYDQKKKQILANYAPPPSQKSQEATQASEPVTATIATKPKPVISAEAQQQLDKLQKLVQSGILTQDEFDQKKKMILASESEQSPKATAAPTTAPTATNNTAVPPPVYVNEQKAGERVTTQLVVRVTNVRASAEHPFQLLLNGQNVMYQSTEDIAENKEIVVRGDIPHMSNEELEVSIDIKMMELGVDATQQFNLTRDGRFIQIGMTSDNKLSIKQQTHEAFDALVVAKKPVREEPTRAVGKTDIFLKFYALKASEEEPFEIYYMDRLLYTTNEDMPPRQIGCVTGQILKERRVNDQAEEDHIVLLKIKCPKIGVEEATATLNLTKDGSKLYVEVLGEDLIVKQSVSDEEFETDFKVVELEVTRAQKSGDGLSEHDFEVLAKLKGLLDAGILSDEEYQAKKDQILNK